MAQPKLSSSETRAIPAPENSCPAPLQTGSGRRLFNLKNQPPPVASGLIAACEGRSAALSGQGRSQCPGADPFSFPA
jgi:hypothetical protein